MKTKKILKTLLIVIASISMMIVGLVLLIAFIFMSDLRKDAQDTNLLDDVITTLDVQYHKGKYYKLIYHVSGFHDKVHFLSVYRDDHSEDNSRVIRDSLLHTVSLDIWSENEPNDRWVKGILVKNDSIYVTYDENLENTKAITNIDVQWNFPAKQREYTLIKDELYKDANDNLYLKVFCPGIKTNLYLSHIYSDDFGVDGVKDIKNVIDLESFLKVDHDLYKDKNHSYKLNVMYDSATLAIVKMVSKT